MGNISYICHELLTYTSPDHCTASLRHWMADERKILQLDPHSLAAKNNMAAIWASRLSSPRALGAGGGGGPQLSARGWCKVFVEYILFIFYNIL